MLSIILVSYNTLELTRNCLKSLVNSNLEEDYEVIIIDNASPDNSYEILKDEFEEMERIFFYLSPENSGFAAGVNLGVSKSQGQYILLLNPDTLILDDAVSRLLAFARSNPENNIWGGVTVEEDGSVNTQHAWHHQNTRDLLFSALGLSLLFKNSAFFNRNNYGGWNRNSDKTVDIISGCFFLTTKKLWNELGGLDESFFMYAEEADFCYKAKLLGFRPKVCSNAKIIHKGGASHSEFSSKLVKLMKGKSELSLRYDSKFARKVNINLLKFYVLNKYLLSLFKGYNSAACKQWNKVLNERSDWSKGYRSEK